ncbi:hypothetical protein [Shimia biformata]|uniref:hypothetical protein n=1 Tax=Shimia biformata TaxID=1294299 RepID=UPI00194F4779|nr:hypothetical protein [Shimia biformata]
MRKLSATVALGLGCIAFGLLIALIWVPFDTDTGLVERSRGRYIVGDSLAPTLAAVFILLSGLMLLVERRDGDARPSRNNLIFIGVMIACGVLSILVMRYSGPLVALLSGADEYRLLRDTAPWKYIGFVLGGVTMICGMIAFVEGRFSLRAFWIALAAVAGIILLYDVPFDDVLLPPNGDV